MKTYAISGVLMAAMAHAGSVELKYGTKFCRTPYYICMMPRILYAFERDENITTLDQMRDRFEYERNICQCKVLAVKTQRDRCPAEGYTCDTTYWGDRDQATWDRDHWDRVPPRVPEYDDIWGQPDNIWKRDASPQLIVPTIVEPKVPPTRDTSPKLIVPMDGSRPHAADLEANHDMIHPAELPVPGAAIKAEDAENDTVSAPERPMTGVPIPTLPISKDVVDNDMFPAPERPMESISPRELPKSDEKAEHTTIPAPKRPFLRLPRSVKKATNNIADATVLPLSSFVIPAELPGVLANDADVEKKRGELEAQFATWLVDQCTLKCGWAGDCPEWCRDRRLFWRPEPAE